MKEQEPIRKGLTNQAYDPTLGGGPMQDQGEVPAGGGGQVAEAPLPQTPERPSRPEEERAEGGLSPRVLDIAAGMERLWQLKRPLRERERDALTPQEQVEVSALSQTVRNTIKELPLSGLEVNHVIPYIARDEEMSDYLLNRIIGNPDSYPGSQYDDNIDFLTRSTLTTFTSAVRENAPAFSKKFGTIQELRRYFHNIQLSLTQGNLDTFAQLATTLQDSHFTEAVDHIGVATVNRLYDEAFWAMGLSEKTTFEAGDFERIERWVRERFTQLIEQRVILNTKFGYARPLEDWEKERALTVGLNFFTIKIRGAELIASAAVANTGGARQWGSFKYESAVRLVNPVRFLIHKFHIGETVGGQAMYEKLEKELEEVNKSLTSEQLPFIGRVRRQVLESSTPLGRTGFETGWRVFPEYLSKIPLRISQEEYEKVRAEFVAMKAKYTFIAGEELRSLGQGQEDNVHYVQAGQYIDAWTRICKDYYQYSKEKKADFLYGPEGKLRPVAQQVDFYLGILLGMDDIPTAMKEDLWKKVSRVLPLRIAYFLVEERDRVLQSHNISGNDWKKLEGKMVLLQELRILRAEEAANQIPDERVAEKFRAFQALGSSQDIVAWYDSLPEAERHIALTDRDKNVIREFIRVGEEKAKDLARVAWPITPFMEDTLFRTSYLELGAEFSRRRIVDAAAVSKAGQEIIQVFANPGMESKDALSHFENALNSLDTPHGREAAQKLLFPFEKAWLLFRRKWGGLHRTPGISGLLKLFRENQSDAQEYFGHTAPADDVEDEREITQVMARRGILRRGGKNKYGKELDSLLETMRKEIGATWADMIWYLLKTFGPLILVLLPYHFAKALREAK